mmetsp:Transcript_2086/g.7064  ORF Transcript_2086/g.7064 Transcript_2086/m.7064 type:complete len:394 (-) Transcript_2086:716-1897(-)
MRLLLLALAAAVAPAAGLNLQMPALRGQTGLTDARFGGKKLVVVTGTSSGLGRKTAAALLRTGKYHVVGAVRDLDKMEVVAEVDGFDPDLFTPMHCELNSFASVRAFVDELKEWKAAKPVDRLICNAAVYQPSLPYAKWSEDGHEQQMQINYLSHFLLTSLLLDDLAKAPGARCVFVGSVTGNDNTVGGGGVYPIADLKKLDGLKLGAKNPISMFDGYNFDGAKAYKDSKLCLAMLSHTLHQNYHKQTGIAFSTVYPGAIADSAMLAGKPPLDTSAKLPSFVKAMVEFELNAMRRIGFGQDMHADGLTGEAEAVSTAQAGGRLLQAAHDVRCSKSGHWAWKEGDAAAEAAAAAAAAARARAAHTASSRPPRRFGSGRSATGSRVSSRSGRTRV